MSQMTEWKNEKPPRSMRSATQAKVGEGPPPPQQQQQQQSFLSSLAASVSIPSTTAFLTLTPLPLVRPEDYGNDAAAMASAFEAMYRYRLNMPPDQTNARSDAQSGLHHELQAN